MPYHIYNLFFIKYLAFYVSELIANIISINVNHIIQFNTYKYKCKSKNLNVYLWLLIYINSNLC